jgi:hypothetical protein
MAVKRLPPGRAASGRCLDDIRFPIPAHKDQVEVPTVSRRICPTYNAGEHPPPKPRAWRQPHEGVGEQAVKDSKADVQTLIQAPVMTRLLSERIERDSDSAHDLHVLLRHRLRIISRRTGRCGGPISRAQIAACNTDQVAARELRAGRWSTVRASGRAC